MPIQTDGQAPYAPTKQVIPLIERYRERGLQTPFTIDVLTRAGVTDALAPRTLRTFKDLDLVDDQGRPTAEFEQLRKASSDEYQSRFAAMIRSAYEVVFKFVDPATDGPEKVRDAFRHFQPTGQQDRMVSLFLGLCEYAGIIEQAPKKIRKPGEAGRILQRRDARVTARQPTAANVEKHVQRQPTTAVGTHALQPDDPRREYFAFLLKKAEEDFSPDLLDRIERVLGLTEPSAAAQGGGDGKRGGEPD